MRPVRHGLSKKLSTWPSFCSRLAHPHIYLGSGDRGSQAADRNGTLFSKEQQMSVHNPQATEDPAPHRLDLRSLASVRTVNIVLALTVCILLLSTGLPYGRRVTFWLTGSVKVDGLTFYLNPK